MCFTDTDSLLFEIETPNIYEDMLRDQDLYDCSEYPTDHPTYSEMNKKVLGKFKDELNSMLLEEFIGFRPKCYSLLFHSEVAKDKVKHNNITSKQTAKGTKKSVKKSHLKHQRYKDTLDNLTTVTLKQNVIKSKVHTIGSYYQKEVALTGFDIKGYICSVNVHTLARGNKMSYILLMTLIRMM